MMAETALLSGCAVAFAFAFARVGSLNEYR